MVWGIRLSIIEDMSALTLWLTSMLSSSLARRFLSILSEGSLSTVGSSTFTGDVVLGSEGGVMRGAGTGFSAAAPSSSRAHLVPVAIFSGDGVVSSAPGKKI